MSAVIRVPPPAGLSTSIVPLSTSAVGQTTQPAACTRVGAADPVVLHVDTQAIGKASDPHGRACRLRVFRRLVKASEMRK